MKTFLLIITTFLAMNTYSQEITTPPTPPTPPATPKAGTTTSGITHAISKTDNSYAFSAAFDFSFAEKVFNIICEEFDSYSKDDFNNRFIREVEGQYYYKIEFKASELKLEYRFDEPKKKDRKSIRKKFKNIQSQVLKL